MTYMDYFSGNGEPVGMYVEYIHKDRNLHTFVMKVFIFENFFKDDYDTGATMAFLGLPLKCRLGDRKKLTTRKKNIMEAAWIR